MIILKKWLFWRIFLTVNFRIQQSSINYDTLMYRLYFLRYKITKLYCVWRKRYDRIKIWAWTCFRIEGSKRIAISEHNTHIQGNFLSFLLSFLWRRPLEIPSSRTRRRMTRGTRCFHLKDRINSPPQPAFPHASFHEDLFAIS